jgi:hypothetical protein
MKTLKNQLDEIQDDGVLAWEPAGDDLWVPFRIRGSWRGGVLG